MEKKSSKFDSMIGRIFFSNYTLIKKLGEGSFGSIYAAKSLHNYYAIKLENKKKNQNLLENEAMIMSYLKCDRVPFVKSFGFSGDYNVLIMELMGKSLEEIFENLPIKRMTVNCVAKLGLQMIEILEFIHNKHIIHRDIKPDNFVMGRGEKKKFLYLLDFGLAKKYRSSTTLNHYPMVKKKNLTGTARYASINALNGLTQSRRDDLEAVGYVLMYFLRGKLPWQGLHVKNKEDRYHKIMEIKMETTPYQLCCDFPPEFEKYVEYTRNLEYEQDPDYEFLKNLFLKVLKDEGYNLDYYYDWDNDVITMTTADTNQNFVRNELNNLQFNQKNILENEIVEKNKIIHEEKEAIFEEKKKDNNENNNENNIKEEERDNIKDNNNIEKEENNNNDKSESKVNDKNTEKKSNEIKLDAGVDDEVEKNPQRHRRHDRYAICGHKSEDNKCCIIF